MDRRLVILTAALPALVAVAGAVPMVAIAASILAAAVVLAWTWICGPAAGLAAAAPGVVLLALTGFVGLTAYAAAATAGVLMGVELRRGKAWFRAIVFGSVPFALWTVGLAVTGFDPFAAELLAEWQEMFGAGDAAVQAGTEQVIAVLKRTWVASEVVWFAVLLVGSGAIARRVGVDLPAAGPLRTLTVSDGWLVPLIAGLVAVLVSGGGTGTTVGWNLVFGAAAVYAVQGFAITVFWMDRAKVGRVARIVFFAGNILLFLPVFLGITSALGLFDSWFDFRRLRTSEKGTSPFSVFRQSSGDDSK